MLNRIRPRLFSEKGQIVVTAEGTKQVYLKKNPEQPPHKFDFDAVYNEDSTQEEVFISVRPLVDK